MVRLLILSCFLLSYFVNINTLPKNAEANIGFRDLFNIALAEDYALDKDPTTVLYRRPRYAKCISCSTGYRPGYSKPCNKCAYKGQPAKILPAAGSRMLPKTTKLVQRLHKAIVGFFNK